MVLYKMDKAMTAEELESALVKEISALDMVANPYPDQPDKYVPNAWPGEILVRYQGADFTNRDISGVQAERVQRVEIVAVGQVLRGEDGIYNRLERIRKRLDGFTMPGAGGHLELVKEEYLDEYNGTWQFGQIWQLKSIVTNEQQDNYADRPLGT